MCQLPSALIILRSDNRTRVKGVANFSGRAIIKACHILEQQLNRLIDIYRSLQQLHICSPGPSLARTREEILFGLLLIGTLVGLIAYIPSVLAAWIHQYYDVVVIDSLFYGWIIALTFLPHLNFRQRALGLILPLWLLAAYLVISFGHSGAGFLWLLVAPILGNLLLGTGNGIALTLLNAIFVLSLWLLAAAGMLHVRLDEQPPVALWAIMGGNLIMINALVTASITAMMYGLQRALSRLEKKNRELALTQDVTIETVATLAEYRDNETGNHILRTKRYVRILAERLAQQPDFQAQLTPEYIELLCKSAPLHDIGKIGVPDAILLKEGRLNEEEMEEMKLHSKYGYEALSRSADKLGHSSFLLLASEIAYTHHERWDGSGYPQGLHGEITPLSGRIMAVADVYDAMISRRIYKAPIKHTEAIDYLVEQRGKLFDPVIIDVLLEVSETFRQTASEYADSEEELTSLAQ